MDFDVTNSNLLGEDFSNAKGKLRDKFKKAVSNVKTGVKKATDKAKAGVKKVTKKIGEKVGKAGKNFRNSFRKVLRKGVLTKIKGNAHGTATKLYPAVGTEAEIKSRKYKASAIAKAKSNYSKLAAKWKDLGGSEADLKAAITEGSKKRFLKLPYKSAEGNNSWDFYNFFAPDTNIYSGQDGTEYCAVDGATSEDGATEEVPSKEESVKGIRAFFAWLKGLFKKEGDENPFEEGSDASKDFESDKKEDAGNEPSESEAQNDVMTELEKTKGDDDAGGATDRMAGTDSKEDDKEEDGADNKILGMPKTAFWIGVGALVLVGGFVAFKLIKKK